MAGVPEYQLQETTQPLPTPFDSTHATPDSFGAPVAGALQDAAGALEHIAVKAKQEADATAVIGAIGNARKALNAIILDPQAGYIGTKGADAIGKRDDFLQKFDDALSKTSQSLANDDQRRVFDQHALTIREEGTRHAYAHEAAQQEDLSKAAFAGAADQTIQSMQSSIGSPADLAKQFGDLRALATSEGIRRFGNNPDAVRSVVVPVLQKAAIDTMEAAASANDPAAAKAAFAAVGPYLLNHERHYAALVDALQKKQEIGVFARTAIAGSTTPVVIPGGQQVPRLDAAGLAARVAAIPAEDPLRDDKAKAVEQQQLILNRVWNQTTAQIADRVHTAGQDPATGDFSLANPKISAADRLWLNQNAPGELDKLRALDVRGTRQDNAQQKAQSSEYYSAVTADLHDPQRWADTYSKMTPPQFLSLLLDEKQFPGGLTAPDRRRAQNEFARLQTTDAKLEEKPGTTVKDEIKAAFGDDEQSAKAFSDKYFGQLLDSANAFVASEKAAGRKVDTDAVRKFVDSKLVKVPGSGFAGTNIGPKRQIQIDAASVVNAPPAAATAPPKGFVGYRYTKDRKGRFPADAQGNRLGPDEVTP